jgi:hypothetical protein
VSWIFLGPLLFAQLSLKNSRTANDNREDIHILISNSREEFNEVKHEIQNTAAEVRGVTSGFENLQSYQQNHLPKLNHRMETIEKLLQKLWEDQYRRNTAWLPDPGITDSPSTLAMQNSVSGKISGLSSAKLRKGSIFSSEVDRETKCFTNRSE